MTDNRRISISIPTYNRDEVLFESFAKVYDDPRVAQISISDDASDIDIFHSVRQGCLPLSKVFLTRNLQNRDCFFNKKIAVEYSDQERTILLDSDNSIGKDYLDVLYAIPEWDNKTIYTPSFAAPHFDFRAYEGLTITKENVAEYIDKPLFETMLNASNYFINKNEWLRVWDSSIDPVTSDSVWVCLKWLQAGGKIFVTPELHYQHRVWPSSHYQTQNHRTPTGFHESILQQLRNMK